MCVNFTNLNKVCPKDCYLLPRIDQLVDSTTGCEIFCFLDAFKGYHQIALDKEDQEKTSFITEYDTYCYTTRPFGLKNAGEIYQRLVNKLFKNQIGRNMDVYVDDMLVKSRTQEQFIDDLREIFSVLQSSRMLLNPKKCTFGVRSGKFLGYMIFKYGVRVNPDKVKVSWIWLPPEHKGGPVISWQDDSSEQVPVEVRRDPIHIPSGGKRGDQCSAGSGEGPSPETRVLCQLSSARSSVKGAEAELTRDTAEAEQAGETVELTQATKAAQAELTRDTIEFEQAGEAAEVTQAIRAAETEQTRKAAEAEQAGEAAEVGQAGEAARRTTPTWTLFVDGASSKEECGVGLLLTSPTGEELAYALRFDFKASNNESEYETLIAGMVMAQKLGAESIRIYSDSQLIVNQVLGNYEIKKEPLKKYVAKVHELRIQFKLFVVEQVPRSRNKRADALSKLASTSLGMLNKEVLVVIFRGRAYDQLDAAVI
ncbi:uncharacterized protein [Coffea arabica]|uniref:RNase H type-1 domain-containing protein n=1 Tax=Coffea arabica TaxID=13443 RepID=A0ABM4V966_COFAR